MNFVASYVFHIQIHIFINLGGIRFVDFFLVQYVETQATKRYENYKIIEMNKK